VIFVASQGLESFKKALVINCLRYQDFPHLGFRISPGSIQVLDKVHKMRDGGQLVVPWEDFANAVMSGDGDLIGNERALQEEAMQLNAVVSIPCTNPSRIIWNVLSTGCYH
jgi:hypothetical protein